MDAHPRVSFFLMTYKHEAFVARALRTLFAQEWPNLQIVISDDASPDGTRAIIEAEVAAYDGPHQVVVNFNERNLKFTHLTKIMGLCDGTYIIQGHGDDMFHPQRTAKMVEAFQQTGADVVTCNAIVVDREDRPQRLWRDPQGIFDCSLEAFARQLSVPAGFGAGMAWTRALWETWGGLPPGPRQMDLVWAFRGCLMGGCHFMPEPLVFYRDHGENMSMWSMRKNARDEQELLMVNERNVGNVAANVVSFIDMVQAHLGRHPQDARARAALTPLIQQLLGVTGQWTRMRHDMAVQGIGVV